MARFDVNCSILFTELPILQRPAAARAAGFTAVEFWWPWSVAVPPDAEVDDFVGALRDAGVRLVGLNFFAGDMPAVGRGLVAWPGRSAEFRDNLDVAVSIGEQLGCRAFNALYGNRVPDTTPERQDELAVENLTLAGAAAGRIGGVVLVEPVSGAPAYPLLTAADAVGVIERVERSAAATNLRFLCDLYHLAVNGDDPPKAISGYFSRIGHVQIADAPGRNEPGTGQLPIQDYLAARGGRLRRLGGSGIQTKRGQRRQLRLAAARTAGGTRPRLQPGTFRLTGVRRRKRWEAAHDHNGIHRSWHHGRPDGGQPRQGRPCGRRLQPAS
jgi:hydroxypyruvate isomerase